MAADSNVVEILVKSRDEAVSDLDDLKARLDELSEKVATARADVDDEDAAAKLDRLQAKLIDLGSRVTRPKITMSGAVKAEADIHAVEASLDNLNRKTDEAEAKAGSEGLLSKILTGSEGSGGGGIMSLFGGGLMSPGGIGAIIGVIGTALPEIVAVVSGLAAAGAGAVSFGALAAPAFEKVKGALGDTRAQLAKLSPDEQGAVEGIRGLTTEFGRMSQAFEPEAFKVFNAGLQLANRLLPDITPFARTFADVVSRLLTEAGQFASSKGFADWLAQFRSLEGPALGAIGDGLGKVAIAFGKLLTVFSGKDVANGINIAFSILAGTINGVRLAVELLKTGWDKLSQDPAVKRIAGDIKTAWNDISTTGKKKPDFSGLTSAVKDAVSTAVTWLSAKLTPLIHSALQTAASWLQKNAYPLLAPVGKALMEGLISGIESNIPSLLPVLGKVAAFIAEHKGPLDYDRQLLVPHGRAIMQGLMGGMTMEMPALRSQLAGISGTISGGIPAGHAPAAAAAAGGPLTIQLTAGSGGTGLDNLFMTWLKNNVRASGGDPNIFTKKVKFL